MKHSLCVRTFLISSLTLTIYIVASALLTTPAQASTQLCGAAAAKTHIKAKDGHGNYTLGVEHALRTWYMNKIEVKNTSATCTFELGLASYAATQPYWESVKTQYLFRNHNFTLKPHQVYSYTIPVPECTYQTDFYQGTLLKNFKHTTYSAQGRLLDAWYFPGDQSQRDSKRPACPPKTTPTSTPTPTPTPSPTPTPTPTLTPTPTKVKPTTTPTVLPTTTVVATPTKTPERLPDTGPGVAVVISLVGMVGGLVGRKYWGA